MKLCKKIVTYSLVGAGLLGLLGCQKAQKAQKQRRYIKAHIESKILKEFPPEFRVPQPDIGDKLGIKYPIYMFDADGDGDLDIIALDTRLGPRVFENKESLRKSDIKFAVAYDFDKDGDLDIITVTWEAELKTYENKTFLEFVSDN